MLSSVWSRLVSINAALLQSIRLRLGRGISPSFGTATHVADIYEAYILVWLSGLASILKILI
jgi:hypothetical protein